MPAGGREQRLRDIDVRRAELHEQQLDLERQPSGFVGEEPGALRVLKLLTAELPMIDGEFMPVARAAVVADAAPTRVAG
ncbi:hypothetical protein [Streptomyces sp. TRM68367]|uniref:hypothetical protein n=1 Tax=Streptomyces sp. TRM68367 TaxID=2758415 RepID=UPI00165C4A24|nr:hypothetical protein [Streptomyces sp. TRM68367]MBC9727741.1 hypothetical protein [Streptomyces sp. TRM68367]